ncbi:GAF domain-containing protein [Acuticoccus sediminis]|uniref:GAF domain-containing protein n=1 Tax=Acuticoccus sediminis TaxID=2184697 RepID=UPI001CFEDF77|nr:GAF domain-containing protein [Acuticoccus sediminis]
MAVDPRFGLGFCAEFQEAPLDARYPEGSAFLHGGDPSLERGIALLCQPLIHQEQTIGILYLESAPGRTVFTRQYVSLMSMLALQATVSFECALLVEALRETSSWMLRGQRIGRM